MLSKFAKATAIVAFGTLEGYAFFRTGMCNPAAIVDQMSFQSMIVMKLFVSAVGTSMLAQSMLNAVDDKRFAASRQMSRTSVGIPRVAAGCLTLGAGMALCGAGPTIVPSQLFGGSSATAAYATGGALVAGVVFSVLEKSGMFRTDVCLPKGGEATSTVDGRSNVPYHAIAAPLGAAMVAAAIGLDVALWPNDRDVARLGTNLQNPWNPIVAGLVIGLNQLPLRLLAQKGQGGSTSIMNIIATLSGGTVAGQYGMRSVEDAAQLLYVWVGTAIGAYVAYQQQVETYHVPDLHGSVPPITAALGGALMLFGARVAMGCTCGHGISGFSELSLQSIVGAACIFGGGIATKLFF